MLSYKRRLYIAIVYIRGIYMNKKEKKQFESMKKEMLINLLNKEIPKMPLLIRKTAGILTEDLVQKSKLISNETYLMLKRERFLMNLRR